MARSRKSKGTVSRRQAKATTRRNISKLRKTGLVKSVAGKRGKRPGGSIYSKLKKFARVLKGEAAVVSAPKRTRQLYRGQFPGARGKLVIPKTKETTAIRVTKRGEIAITRKMPQGKTREIILSEQSDLKVLPPGQIYKVTGPNWVHYFRSYAELKKFLGQSADLPHRLITIAVVNFRDVFGDDDSILEDDDE